jgi:hypothetical protein
MLWCVNYFLAGQVELKQKALILLQKYFTNAVIGQKNSHKENHGASEAR